MSEDADESSKTEDPSGRKLEKAHEKGQWPLSPEIANALAVSGILILFTIVFPSVISGMNQRLTYYVEHIVDFPMDRSAVGHLLVRAVIDSLTALWAPAVLLGAAGVLAIYLQKGFSTSWNLIVPNFGKISPLAGFQRMFSLGTQGVELAKSLAKLAVVGLVAYFVIQPMMISIEHFVGIDLILLLHELGDLVFKLLIGVLLVVFAIAAGDYFYQNQKYTKQMRMTKQEVKDEHKEMEGDPQVKARIRQLRMERVRRRMMAAVPRADVVVTNPTHFAVALKYDQDAMDAPVVVAKGADQLAHRIRDVARENDVPIVENPPLARALYSSVEIDEEIPSEHYRAVAEVITYVMKLRQRSGRR